LATAKKKRAPDHFSNVLTETINPSVIDAFTPLGYNPTPKQKIFHDLSQQKVHAILYGGARAGGKSCAMTMEAIHCAVNFPGMKILCLRRTYPELEESFLAELKKRQYAAPLGGKWNQTDKKLRFANGSEINFSYAETEIDISRILGGEYQLIEIDEASRTLPIIIKHSEENLRSGSPAIPVMGLRLATNPGGTGHCLPYGDVLTPNGWRRIEDITTGDPVYTVRPDGVMVETTVSRTFEYDWDDDIIEVNARGLSMAMTPNHRVAKVGGTKTNQKTKFSLVPFEELPGQATILRSVEWQGKPLPSFTPDPIETRKRKLEQPATLSGDLFAELLGWYLSEGSVVRSGPKAFDIAQSKPDGRDAIQKLLDRCGLQGTWGEKSVRIYAADWWWYFSQFGYSYEKFIPDWVKAGSREDLQILLNALMAGDGHWQSRTGGAYYTISRQLADDVAEIAVKLGYLVLVTEFQRPDRVGPSFTVNIKKVLSGGSELLTGNHLYDVKTMTQRSSNIRRNHYTGKVYCLGIDDTETFIVRQNGSVWVSGNSYLKERFIKPTERGQHLAIDAVGRRVAFIPALYTDNPYINQEQYKQQLDAIDDPARRAAMRDGDWDAQVGQFFEQWSHFKHVIDRHWDLPMEWQRYCGIDYGVHAPYAAVWAAVDNDGRMWVYREQYARGVDARSQAMNILEAEEAAGEYEVIRVADPSMWGNRGTPMSIADVYGLEGCGIMQADNNRPNGWARCHHFLNDGPACEYHTEMGWEECPMMHVFGDECPSFVETVPELPRHPLNPDDAETKNVEDHIPDAWRYLCMTAGTSGGPVIYDNDAREATSADVRQLHEEEGAAYMPESARQIGPFVVGDLRMNL
jgi:hypothetical protein